MNVALLVDDDGSRATGYSNVAASLCRHAAKAGFNFVLVRPRSTPSQPFRSRLYARPCYSVGLKTAGRRHQALAAAQLSRIFRSERIDLVHFQFAGIDHWGFHRLSGRVAPPFVLSFQAFVPDHLARRAPGYERELGRLLDGASAVTAVSQSCQGALMRSFPAAAGKAQVVPNGVESVKAAFARRRFLLSVGDLFFMKGTDVLFFALHDLIGQGIRDFELLSCGRDLTGGAMSGLARRLGLSRHVRLLGPRPHSFVQKLMRDCLFFVSASRTESFGMALVEALAAGKAVVAPRVGGIPDYVTHGRNGLLVPPGDPTALARAIAELLGRPSLRRVLERNAPAAARPFLWSSVVERYLRIYGQASKN